jgi:putative chitinase
MITKKLGDEIFAWNPDAFAGKGYWFVLGKKGGYGRAASKKEMTSLGKPKDEKEPEKQSDVLKKQKEEVEKQLKALEKKSDVIPAEIKQEKNQKEPEPVKKTPKRRTPLSDVTAKNKPLSIDSSDNLKLKFTGSTPEPVKKGDSIADALGKIFTLIKTKNEYNKKIREDKLKSKQEESESQKEHDELIAAIPSKESKSETEKKKPKELKKLEKQKKPSTLKKIAKTAAKPALMVAGGLMLAKKPTGPAAVEQPTPGKIKAPEEVGAKKEVAEEAKVTPAKVEQPKPFEAKPAVAKGPEAKPPEEKVTPAKVAQPAPAAEKVSPSESKPVKVASQQGKDAMVKAMDDAKIEDKTERAAIMAQVAHESGGFSTLSENLNYKAPTLLKLFPKKFKSADDAQQVAAGGPQSVAERIYGGRMGNGPEGSGDGFKYRGRGFIQLTGKQNYTRFGVAGNPDSVSSVKEAADTAIKYMAGFKGNWGDITSVTKFVNGGTIGLDDRKKQFDAFLNDPSITKTGGSTTTAVASNTTNVTPSATQTASVPKSSNLAAASTQNKDLKDKQSQTASVTPIIVNNNNTVNHGPTNNTVAESNPNDNVPVAFMGA